MAARKGMEHGIAKILLGIYQLLGWLSFFTLLPLFLIFSCVTGRYRHGLLQRLGIYRYNFPPDAMRFWIHAASVGEAQAAHKILTALRVKYPTATFIITTVTEQGRQIAQKLSGEYATIALAPLGFPFCAYLAVKALQPTAYVCLETELWPNILYFLHRSGAKLFITNGRISERSFRRYRRLLPLTRFILRLFSSIAVIGLEEALRFSGLGADEKRLHITGNIKFDLGADTESFAALENLRDSLDVTYGSAVFVCGSTRSGEEEQLLAAFLELKGSIPGLIWIVAPRHLERIREIESLFGERKIVFQFLSRCRTEGRKADVILVDSIGELRLLYGLGTYIFCGGSLAAKGGHNIMEAAVWGRPVFYGPHMEDFQAAKDMLEEVGAGLTIQSAAELAREINALHEHPRQYEQLCKLTLEAAARHQGIAEKQADIIADFL